MPCQLMGLDRLQKSRLIERSLGLSGADAVAERLCRYRLEDRLSNRTAKEDSALPDAGQIMQEEYCQIESPFKYTAA